MKRRREERGEHWTQMIRNTMEEPAWRALSSTAQALYPWLKFEWRGANHNNNGKIRLSVRQAAERVGVRKETAGVAFHELQRKGFLVQTEGASLGTEGAAKSPAYELTELALPGQPSGRKLFRDWREGNDFEAVVSASNNPSGKGGRKIKPRLENRYVPVSKTETKSASPS